MTPHERILALLDDFVDGHLEPSEREEVAAHLESCPSCALELKSLRSLLKEAGELPEGLEPPRDLWPELAVRLMEAPAREPAEVIGLDGLQPTRADGSSLLSLRSATWLLAAVLAFVLLVPPTLRELRTQSPPARSNGKNMLALCSKSMIEDYRTVFAQSEESLPSDTQLALNKSLDQIEQALHETVAAMNETDMNSPEYRSLAAGYRNKLNLLQRIAVQTNTL